MVGFLVRIDGGRAFVVVGVDAVSSFSCQDLRTCVVVADAGFWDAVRVRVKGCVGLQFVEHRDEPVRETPRPVIGGQNRFFWLLNALIPIVDRVVRRRLVEPSIGCSAWPFLV